MGRHSRWIVWVVQLALALSLAAGCTQDRTPGREQTRHTRIIKDAVGREVMIPDRVDRVVDLALLDGTRTMVQLQVAGKLAGVNDQVKNFMYGEKGQQFSCWFAPPRVAPHLGSLTSVGTCREPNIELLKSLKADIILAYASYSALARALEEQTGLPVVCLRSAGSFDFNMIRLVGDITGQQQRAQDLAAYSREKIEQIVAISSKIPENRRLKVFFWGWPVQESPKTIAPYDPIDLAGGVNVAMQAQIKPYDTFDITKEQLAVWNPDIILLQWWTSKNIGVRTDTILSDPALQTIAAVKNKKVFYSRNFMKGWDPAMGLCELFYLAKLFYPELYPNLDVEKQGNEILTQFYGTDGLYTDFVAQSKLHRFKQAVDN